MLRLLIADPVEEPNVQPVNITAAQLSQHYADWVTLSNLTMADASTGQDGTGTVRMADTFHQKGYQAPTAGDKVNASGIVTSSLADGDILSLAANNAKARAYNPTIDFTHVYPFMTPAVTNGIGAVGAHSAADVAVFDLSGHRVATGTAHLSTGIYIIGGRKTVIK